MTDLDFKVIGEKIRKRRKALGITQEYIANILSCSVDCFIGGKYTYHTDEKKRMLWMI